MIMNKCIKFYDDNFQIALNDIKFWILNDSFQIAYRGIALLSIFGNPALLHIE